MASVTFHPEADAEYQAAYAWYLSHSQQAAAGFQKEMDRVLASIGTNPELYPAYDDEHRFTVLKRYHYTIIYQVLPTYVLIVAVAHSSRDAGYWAGRT